MPVSSLDDSAAYGAIIVGGGIQGLMVALAAAERGLKPLVLERAGLGAGASTASMGIVHGGLRYLQSLDIPRWYRSRENQRWFGQEFRAYCKPLRCRMPLYHRSFRSPGMFRAAFVIERLLSNLAASPSGLPPPRLKGDDHDLPSLVPRQRLTAVAEWSELALEDGAGLLAHIAERIEAMGGRVTLHEEATSLEERPEGGLLISTRREDREVHYNGRCVMLCVGAASRSLARCLDRDIPALSARTLAFNLLLDRPMEVGTALALSANAGHGRSYFLRGYEGRILAGTFYHPLSEDLGGAVRPAVPQALIERAMREIVQAAPQLQGSKVVETWSGALPDTNGQGVRLRNRDLLYDHGRHGGPRGLYTLLGTKLTTSRSLALSALDLEGRKSPDRQRSAPRKAAA